jgi:hypothetical protein
LHDQLVAFTDRAPALVAAGGARASYRFFEFFTANIRNPHTGQEHAKLQKTLMATLKLVIAANKYTLCLISHSKKWSQSKCIFLLIK